MYFLHPCNIFVNGKIAGKISRILKTFYLSQIILPAFQYLWIWYLECLMGTIHFNVQKLKRNIGVKIAKHTLIHISRMSLVQWDHHKRKAKKKMSKKKNLNCGTFLSFFLAIRLNNAFGMIATMERPLNWIICWVNGAFFVRFIVVMKNLWITNGYCGQESIRLRFFFPTSLFHHTVFSLLSPDKNVIIEICIGTI